METMLDVQTDKIRSYLNDHQAGSVAGAQLAERIAKEHPEDEFFAEVSNKIQDDQATLERLMEKFGTEGSAVKQVGASVMEMVGGAMGGATGSDDLSFLRQLETLIMGVKGKHCLWDALQAISDVDDRIGGFNLERMISSAEEQLRGLEERQVKTARKALTS